MSTRRPTSDSDDALLLRRLHGELAADARRALERRLGAEPALRARDEALRAAWAGLDLPAPPPAPPGFRTRLVALAAAERRGELSWALAPAWARTGAAAALIVGVALGAGFGQVGAPSEISISDDEPALFSEPITLAETYWLSFEDDEAAAEEAAP